MERYFAVLQIISSFLNAKTKSNVSKSKPDDHRLFQHPGKYLIVSSRLSFNHKDRDLG